MIGKAFWWLIGFVAAWGWWIGGFLMVASAIQVEITDGHDTSVSFRLFLAMSWWTIAFRDRELRHVRGQLDNTREQRDRAFERIRTLDPKAKR